ncbi:DUF1415 domain-containing protein [Denitromonas sp. IR12]|uniref:DUF1415 domain-containing protein n=1 Tax=Denitromonas iodatirespirans TaxID=2795389 RepID=A0A944D3X0_DENI1|nr:DUF1415 domain-containing protein [Denitromonas iodatirespirans]
MAPVRRWLETLVIGLNLCPFAKRELAHERVRFYVSEATTDEQLQMDLEAELALLAEDETIETTLLIHPHVLQDFFDYNQFLNHADRVVAQLGYRGTFQIASFHPDYQFGGTEPDDVENTTNRSPYPLLHLIREASLARAVAHYPDPDQIPERNIARVEALGAEKMQALLDACFDPPSK